MQIKKIAIILACVALLLAAGFSRAHFAALKLADTEAAVSSKDELEEHLFGRAIPEYRNGEYRVGVKCLGGIYAELTVYQAKDCRYEKVFSCPAVIGKNGPGKQVEGDVKTPLGTWTVGNAYGIKPDPGSLIPYKQITDDMYWCGDSANGKAYNKLIYHSDDPSADHSEDEHLIDVGDRYNYLLDMGYNAACAPYCGSALFLHCWRNSNFPTHGCVGIAEENMVKVLQTITPGTSITIY